MTKRIVASSTVLLACLLAPESPLAVGRGSGHSAGSFQGAKKSGVETHQQMGGRDLVNRDGSRFQDSHSFGLGGAGRAFRHAFGRVAGVFKRPAGWDRGTKKGWRGDSTPPGLAKKQSSGFAFLHHGPFARRGEGPFANPEILRRRVANFDRFLDLHPGLEKSLTQNPSLINNQAFLAAHPSLESWLRAHPKTAEELRENPQAFMNRERRFDAWEARFPGDEDITRAQVANFDRFLDANPTLAARLRANPSLINNSAFLAQHPSLNTWLKNHPEVAEELRENPQAFMNRERRFDALEARFPRGDEDINRGEIANFDRFLDSNPSIAASLKANPSLINNSAFLAQHPSLSTWLKNHPEAAEELRENPQAFMSREQRLEATPPEPLEASNDL